MAPEAARIACPECDLLVELPPLEASQQALCPRCRALLTVCRADPFSRSLAYSVAALVMLAIAFAFPFLSISRAGVSSSMTLFQTVSYLAEYGADAIAVLVLIFVILVPAIMLVLMVGLSASLRGSTFPGFLLSGARVLFHLNAWSMVEVFSIGVIVSLVKLAALATVELGISFWAYLAFSGLFLAANASFDKFTVWSTIARLRGAGDDVVPDAVA